MPGCTHMDTIDTSVTPSDTTGCTDCLAIGARWLHLRMCMQCGHVGCCDSSPNKHASKHAAGDSHPIAASFELQEDWLWCYVDNVAFALQDYSPPSHD